MSRPMPKLATAAATVALLAASVAAAAPSHAAVTQTKTKCTGWTQVSNTAVYMRACTTAIIGQGGVVKAEARNYGAKSRTVGLVANVSTTGGVKHRASSVHTYTIRPKAGAGRNAMVTVAKAHGTVGGTISVVVNPGKSNATTKRLTAPSLSF